MTGGPRMGLLLRLLMLFWHADHARTLITPDVTTLCPTRFLLGFRLVSTLAVAFSGRAGMYSFPQGGLQMDPATILLISVIAMGAFVVAAIVLIRPGRGPR